MSSKAYKHMGLQKNTYKFTHSISLLIILGFMTFDDAYNRCITSSFI